MTGAFSVNVPDLEAMVQAFDAASLNVADLPGGLASRASGPESTQVIGQAASARRYVKILDAWRGNLTQITASLENLSRAMRVTAQLYADTETANTPQQAP